MYIKSSISLTHSFPQTISTGKTLLPKTFTSQLNKNCQDDHLTAAFTALTEAVQIEARVKQ